MEMSYEGGLETIKHWKESGFYEKFTEDQKLIVELLYELEAKRKSVYDAIQKLLAEGEEYTSVNTGGVALHLEDAPKDEMLLGAMTSLQGKHLPMSTKLATVGLKSFYQKTLLGVSTFFAIEEEVKKNPKMILDMAKTLTIEGMKALQQEKEEKRKENNNE